MFPINEDWSPILCSEYTQPYFKSLMSFLNIEYQKNICFPPKDKIFNAFNLCPYKELKLVLIGQDPYHGPGQANGLAFSVNSGIPIPPSLKNIFKELEIDLKIPNPKNGDLSNWASQGVLLLNSTLTVRQADAGSHQKKGWEQFTNNVIKKISKDKSNVVFFLWGGYALKKLNLIDSRRHFVLQSAHPSPLSANRGRWFGNRHFSKANNYLTFKGKTPIDW